MHFRAQGVANPLHRFLGQFVERDDRQFKMLLLRVLHLVVTDAVQALQNIMMVGTHARTRPRQRRGADRKEDDAGLRRSPRIASSDRAMRRREGESVRFATFDPKRL